MYAQINKDLDDAIGLFTSGSAVPNKSHLSLNAARAIKARVALTMQDYATAAAMAKAVIDDGDYSLMSNEQYEGGFNDISNPEWIWGAFMHDDQGDTFGSYHAQISWDGNTTYIRSRPKRINSALYALISAAGDNKWQFAIPIAELQANPNSSQND